MDDPGWRARRREKKDLERGFRASEQIMPMQEDFIGGFQPGALPMPEPAPPSPPPKDERDYSFFRGVPGLGALNHALGQDSPSPPLPTPWVPAYPSPPSHAPVSPAELSHRSAVERSQTLRVARMHPHLQFMCGPLLRYDTVDAHKVWHGFALIVTSDAGSSYEPFPMLIYEYDPDEPARRNTPASTLSRSRSGASYELGPHPADPTSSVLPKTNDLPPTGPNARMQRVYGQEIWVYPGHNGTFTFWRFPIQIPLGHNEMKIRYTINNGQELQFYVPGREQNMRWATHSCNGFSAGVNQDQFTGPGFKSGFDPLWMDLLRKHEAEPFHVLVGGGDQLYCDGVTREPELQEWITASHGQQKLDLALTDDIKLAIDRYYFNHYCQSFRSGAFARANSSIPMLNMLDDHDLIDGFGSYPDTLQRSPIFNRIGSRGYFFFLLFQCFINPAADGVNDKQHSNRSLIIGGPGPYIPFPSHSFLSYLGPQIWILMLDCRAERRKDQVCSRAEYVNVFERMKTIPRGVEHLVVQVGIPIAYPRLVFLETALESKFNPLVALGKGGSKGLSGFINKFNADAELLDDLNDHWTAKSHKKERNWFIQQMQGFAKDRRVRVSFLSGDVHCAAVGVLKTFQGKGKTKLLVPPEGDFRYMLNVVTSAIVNTPPPMTVLAMVGALAGKTHKSMHYCDTDETMIPLFDKDTDGSALRQKYIMGRRNWTSVQLDSGTGELVWDIRVEGEKGRGVTKGCVSCPGLDVSSARPVADRSGHV